MTRSGEFSDVHTHHRLSAATEHNFKIGQVVYFRPKISSAPLFASSGPYQITRRLPAAEGEFQYVIRSANEDHERVAKESERAAFEYCTPAAMTVQKLTQ